MTCVRCNDTRRVIEYGADPCATPDEVWCPDCSNPPPPYVPADPGFYWGRRPMCGLWEPVCVHRSLNEPGVMRVSLIGNEWSFPVDEFEFGAPLHPPAPHGFTS